MSGVNTTTDARSALKAVIAKRYDQDITGEAWLTKSPSGAPPDEGLGSGDAIDWLMSLDQASAKMAKKYVMAEMTRAEASGAREGKLSASVALLASKATPARRVRNRRRNLALFLGAGALAGLAAVLASFRRPKGDNR